MGYFSDLAVDFSPCDVEEYNCVSPETKLITRLKDLENRLSELLMAATPVLSYDFYSDDDLRFVLPEDFGDIHGVKRAVEAVKDDLSRKYGVNVSDIGDTELSKTAIGFAEKDMPYGQITFIGMALPCVSAA